MPVEFLEIALFLLIINLTNSQRFQTDDYEYCVCVPFWQCNEDNNGFNIDGTDLVDIRIFNDLTEDLPICKDFDVCCRIQCGKRGGGDPLPSRIIGGKQAKFAEFPWMLGVIYRNNYHCGASLIHPKVALTAAHCVANSGIYTVRAGEWNWENTNEPIEHQDRIVEKIIIHSLYQPDSLKNDIALLILKNPFELDENVGIACLPPSNIQYEGAKCIATGWGRNSPKTDLRKETILKKIDLPIVPRLKCMKALQEARLGKSFVLHKSFLCAGGEFDRDTCKGDGGSPLVCLIDGELDRYEQVGIVAWGLTCGQHNTPGVYVNVAFFSNWIDKQMRLHNFNPQIYKY